MKSKAFFKRFGKDNVCPGYFTVAEFAEAIEGRILAQLAGLWPAGGTNVIDSNPAETHGEISVWTAKRPNRFDFFLTAWRNQFK